MLQIKVIIFVIIAAFYCSSFTKLSIAANTNPLPIKKVAYWAYQIQALDNGSSVDTLAQSKYDMLVIDPTVTSEYDFNAKAMVAQLKNSKASDGNHRKLVIAYLDIGQAEEWRWYWHNRATYEKYGQCKNNYIQAIQSWAPWVVACDPDGWGGNYPVAYWSQAWQQIVINGTSLGSGLSLYFNSMLDEVIKDGFDGVYLDWVEAWEMPAVQQRAQQEGIQPAPAMLHFIRAIKGYGKRHNPSFLVIQQNSSELINHVPINDLKMAVDAIAQEGIWWDGDAIDDNWDDPNGFDQASGLENYYLPRLRKYKQAGLPVLVCDYAVNKAQDVYTKSAAEGFVAYATRRPLSRITTTPPQFKTTPPTVAPIFNILLQEKVPPTNTP